MKLHELITAADLQLRCGSDQLEIGDLVDDSRRATPGCVFLARNGIKSDGRCFVDDAIARGAVAVIGQFGAGSGLPASVAWASPGPGGRIDSRRVGRLAGAFFGSATGLLRVAVTGTNGKTTTAMLARELLERVGLKTGLIGTIWVDNGSAAGRSRAELTTPGAIELHRLLAQMVDHGCRAAVLEISSHALHQGRTAGMQFDCGIFTNLTQDHLDYHCDMQAYAEAKAILFDTLSPDAWAVVNADDAWVYRMVRQTKARVVLTSRSGGGSIDSVQADGKPQRAHLSDVELCTDCSRATYTGPWGSFSATLPLIGRHNAVNALQAVAAVHALTGVGAEILCAGLVNCSPIPGRLERVEVGVRGSQFAVRERNASRDTRPATCGTPPASRGTLSATRPTRHPSVFVDYAHTPDALGNVLEALRPLVAGRLIVLTGCGGDRDRTKRPLMARVACELADQVHLTSDNPRAEDPQAIIADMLEGVPAGVPIEGQGFCSQIGVGSRSAELNCEQRIANAPRTDPRVIVIVDRAQAIHHCILSAESNDTILIAGKGHEDYQIIGLTKRRFDDCEHAAAAMAVWAQEQEAPSREGNVNEAFWTAANVATLIGGAWLENADPIKVLSGMSIDSRTIQPGQVFFAIAGENFDGHDFVGDAFARGASMAVVDARRQASGVRPQAPDVSHQSSRDTPPADCGTRHATRLLRPASCDPPPATRPVLAVPDTVFALQQLASAWRDVLGEAGCKVIAVAGSNGKTTTRHLIHHVLCRGGLTGSQSPKSFNNHLGVPLTLLGAHLDHDFVACEIGTNHPGEVAALAAIVRPDLAVITSIGREHLEYFGSLEQVEQEEYSLLSFVSPTGVSFTPRDGRRPYAGALGLSGSHNRTNAAYVQAVAEWFGLSEAQIAHALQDVEALPGRGQILDFGPVIVIHDAYNANPDSVGAAIEMIDESFYDPQRRGVFVFGDMMELGTAAEASHREVGYWVAEARPTFGLLITIGPLAGFAAEELLKHWPEGRIVALPAWSDGTPQCVAQLLEPGDIVLLKGSRTLGLERLIPAIEQRFSD